MDGTKPSNVEVTARPIDGKATAKPTNGGASGCPKERDATFDCAHLEYRLSDRCRTQEHRTLCQELSTCVAFWQGICVARAPCTGWQCACSSEQISFLSRSAFSTLCPRYSSSALLAASLGVRHVAEGRGGSGPWQAEVRGRARHSPPVGSQSALGLPGWDGAVHLRASYLNMVRGASQVLQILSDKHRL